MLKEGKKYKYRQEERRCFMVECANNNSNNNNKGYL